MPLICQIAGRSPVNALVFLGIALGLSLAGCLVLWFRSRQPGSMEAHIRDFARELEALAPGPLGNRTRGRQGNRDDREPRPQPRPGPERPPERGSGPERPPERGSGPERPPERGTERRSG